MTSYLGVINSRGHWLRPDSRESRVGSAALPHTTLEQSNAPCAALVEATLLDGNPQPQQQSAKVAVEPEVNALSLCWRTCEECAMALKRGGSHERLSSCLHHIQCRAAAARKGRPRLLATLTPSSQPVTICVLAPRLCSPSPSPLAVNQKPSVPSPPGCHRPHPPLSTSNHLHWPSLATGVEPDRDTNF